MAAAVVGTPMVLGYRMHPLTYALSRRLAHVEHVGLVNLVAGRRIVAELLQDDFTAENLAREAGRLMAHPGARMRQKEAYKQVRLRMGPPGVFRRAAREVISVLLEDSPFSQPENCSRGPMPVGSRSGPV
ncbi:MAG: hypothetical protein ACE5ID_01105 [Acidobacteriota bacterium]